MFLSRLTLNPDSPDARRDAAFAYEMHRTLTRIFENAPKNQERILFRTEWDHHERYWKVLILSRTLPDFGGLPLDYARKIEGPIDYDEKLDKIAPSQRLAFRLLANPTKKTKNDKGEPKRKPLLKDDEQEQWLRRKVEEAGAEILECTVNSLGLVKNYKHGQDSEPSKQLHHAVLFEGVLQVNDPARLKAAIARGIGSGKGFGFGLLSLAPTR